MAIVNAISALDERRSATSCIYYPLWFARFKVSWRRLLLAERTEEIWICVDGVRGVAQRADSFPESCPEKVPDSRLLPLGIGGEDALGKARALAEWWARTRLFAWWAPLLEHRELHLLYKVYLIEQGSAGAVLRDSTSGESEVL